MYEVRGMEAPLFGETRPRDRYLNYFIGVATSLLVLFTFISSLVKPWPPAPNHVFLSVAIVFVCIGELVLIFWYRRGDLDPKFRQLIYYNCFTLVLLCVCANVFFYDNKL
ncbi:transmembrane protein 243 isoform X2 [Nematostella vectensis]|uniref:transmembrane protein 243 isoform X2 n=1 Tax=Nematostella vectensis TaxID=45351 RepID=UPI00138FC738|nr:transmembrane protein 243 isoform X2 [Nematostella vectensis]